MWLKYAFRQLRMDARNAYAFGGDDGPVKHLVFWYMYDNRENLRPGRVPDWDRNGLVEPRNHGLYYTLFIMLYSWIQKLDGWRREDVVAESDRRVDDARVRGHRLGRRGIHDREHTPNSFDSFPKDTRQKEGRQTKNIWRKNVSTKVFGVLYIRV
tara:strand:- start:73 stop:537 length:465 start_codon:yes stop_codon:yes gene_type:complete